MLKRLDGASAYEPSRRSEGWIKASVRVWRSTMTTAPITCASVCCFRFQHPCNRRQPYVANHRRQYLDL